MTILIGDIVRKQAKVRARKIGLVDGDRHFTYEETNARVNRLANALLNLGMVKGDRVAFVATNCHRYVEAYFAVAKLGLVIVPINSRASAGEIVQQLAHSECNAIIYQTAFDEVAKSARHSAARLEHLIRIGDAEEGTHSYEALLGANPADEPQVGVSIDDVMMIMYTSGATGEAKGVVTAQRNLLATTQNMTIETGVVPEDINLQVMPLFHAGGIWPTMTHFYRGARTILQPGFDELKVLQTVEKEKVTFLNLVPTTLRRLTLYPDLKKYNLESLRFIMYGASPIAINHLREAMSLLGAHRFFTGLGSTEAGCGGVLTLTTREHALALDGPLADKLGSVGRDMAGVETRIVDDDGNELPPGQIGEIIARGDNVTRGYLKLPEQTAQTFRNGWLYFGDQGYRDEDGYVFVVGRKKDLIISGGEKIVSREVEETIMQHPAVEEVAVLGVPDEVWGEAVKAGVVLKPGHHQKITGEDIISFCREMLATYKRPKSVDIVAELPKNAAGKIAKAELQKRYREDFVRRED